MTKITMKPLTCLNRILILFFLVSTFMKPLRVNCLPPGYEDHYIEGFRYGLFVPPDYNPEKKYHLMLYLHGYSDTTSWNFSWYQPDFQAQFPTIVLTPKCLTSYTGGWGTSWDMQETYAIRMTFRALDSTLKHFNIDQACMHVGGTSMGGFGTFYVLASRPGMFASAYAICGGGNPETASLIKNTPLWIFHGDKDPIVPVSQSRNMYHAILEAGGTLVRYTEYPGVAHNSWENAGRETTLDPWLFAQKLGSEHGIPDPVDAFSCKLGDNNKPLLQWNAPSDQNQQDKIIWCYRIYRDGDLITILDRDSSHFTDNTALPNTRYSYSINTVNYYFKESAPSHGSVTTLSTAMNNSGRDAACLSMQICSIMNTIILNFDIPQHICASLNIYNTTGRQMTAISGLNFPAGCNTYLLNTSNYPAGIYICILDTSAGKNASKFLIDN